MTLRNRFRLVLAVLAFTAVAVLALIGVGGYLRGESVDLLSRELRADYMLVELQSCMQDTQRQMSAFGASLPEVAPADAGGDSEAATTGLLQDDLKKSLKASFASCREQSNALKIVALDLSSAELQDVGRESDLLLADWIYVAETIERDYVAAITRQAISAQPRSEALFASVFPTASTSLKASVSHARESLASTSMQIDRTLLVCLAFGFMVIGFVLYGLIARLSYGMQVLTDGAIAFGRGDLEYKLRLRGDDEFGRVSAEMNRMATDLNRTTDLLAHHAKKLEANLKTLKETQADLVREQRMAALGGLVAGVAHEVNTPLGVAFTAGTFCRDRFVALQALQSQGPVSDDELQAAMEDGADALALMIDNLAKAAHLIESFKQVAVDRGQPDTRLIKIDSWLSKVITSLSPLTKRHTIEVQCGAPVDLECTLAAGELEQVISNLIVNAVVHAFPDEHRQKLDGGPKVEVKVDVRESAMWSHVVDNGRGMPPEELAQVFEPFFTTKRGEGGSGLGMHIVHQIVHDRFEGSISGQSSPGAGTTWVIQIPYPTLALAFGS